MGRIFCETKKLIVILLVTIMISIIIAPISNAAHTDSMRVGDKYEYRGGLIISYRSKDAAKKSNIFKIKGVLTIGDKITIEEIDGNILKIGNQKYIKLDILNNATKFKKISDVIEEPQPPKEEEEIQEELIPEEEPEPQPMPQPPVEEPVEIIKVKGIELNKNQGNLYEELGWEYKIKATIKPENATNKNIKWKSSNEKILIVDQNGKITGKSIGTATITATTEDGGYKATCKVRVTRLEINKTKVTINIGEKTDLEIKYAGEGKKKDIEWKSSNEKIATVDANGKVTAKKEGKVTITAKAKQNRIEKYCEVTVKKVDVKKINLNKTKVALNKGETITLTGTIEPTNATNKKITWKSDNTKIATVTKEGKVTAKTKGETKIRAIADGKEATCKITVSENVKEIELNKNQVKLYIGETFKLNATVKPSNAANKELKWESNDATIATVSKDGTITAKGLGETKIIVTAKDGSGTKAVCTITVEDPYKYTFGKNTYKIAVKKEKLDSVLGIISENGLYQNASSSLSYHCDEVANYHIYLLQDIKKVTKNNKIFPIVDYDRTELLAIGNNAGTTIKFSDIKENIDKGKAVRLHVDSKSGWKRQEHWVTVVGYKGSGEDLKDFLIISSAGGYLIKGGTGDAVGMYGYDPRIH